MRIIYNMNSGWKFHRGEIAKRNFDAIHAVHYDVPEWIKAGNQGLSKSGFDTSKWTSIDLPHDYVVEEDFDESANATHGSLPVQVGWYQKVFEVPNEADGKRIFLEFDGVFRDCELWLNGHFVGKHTSGYTSFSFDVTELCELGVANALAVRVDPRTFELWSYEGGGIYRDVRLLVTDSVRVAYNGMHIRPIIENANEASSGLLKAVVQIQNNSYAAAEGTLTAKIIGADGVALNDEDFSFSVQKLSTSGLEFEMPVNTPLLWHPEHPHLYTLIVELKVDSGFVDSVSESFGFRSIRFDSKSGFYINGKSLKIKGVCEHQDHAGVGIAIPHALQRWRVEQVKAMGANAIRTAHNPPDPHLLDICDELGILVVNEIRLPGIAPELMNQMETLIRRDRNHPSVIMWSLGNEEMNIQETPDGPRILRRVQERMRLLDPDRPSTYSANCDFNEIAENFDACGFRVDVFGANYTTRRTKDGGLCCEAVRYDEFHAQFPDWPLFASEAGGTMTTRGMYGIEEIDGEPILPNPEAFKGDPFVDINPERSGTATAYSETMTPWGRSIEDTWKDCATRDFLAGVFLWSGFDYRGETYPFSWPSVVTRYGLLDLCGFPKDAYHYYKSQWVEAPVLHLFPHWNWGGREGESIDVWCYSNHAQVELFLNGKSLGRKTIKQYGKGSWVVVYEPGTLEAVGYDLKGEAVDRKTIQTTNAPHAIQLGADRETYCADGEDVIIISASIIDSEGRVVPTANDLISMDCPTGLTFLGSGNGSPTCHEANKTSDRSAYNGFAQFLFKVGREVGELTLSASSSDLETGSCTVRTAAASNRMPEIGGQYETTQQSSDKQNAIDGAL